MKKKKYEVWNGREMRWKGNNNTVKSWAEEYGKNNLRKEIRSGGGCVIITLIRRMRAYCLDNDKGNY